GEFRLRVGLYPRVDAEDRCDQQFLDERILERPLEGRHRLLIAVRPTETATAVFRLRLAAEPAEDGLLDVAVLAHDTPMFEASRMRTRPVRRSCRRDFLSSVRATCLVTSAAIVAFDAFITPTISCCSPTVGGTGKRKARTCVLFVDARLVVRL